MPPTERFVWAMLVLIVALVGLVAIEVSFILVTGAVNDEILIVISGLSVPWQADFWRLNGRMEATKAALPSS